MRRPPFSHEPAAENALRSRRRFPFTTSKNRPAADLKAAPPTDRLPLLKCARRLVESAASHLGLDEDVARLVARTATLAAGDKTIFILPVGRGEGGLLALVLSVQTTVPVGTDPGAVNPVEVLQHAPAALHAFSASIGCTPDGCWSVCRSVHVPPDGGAALAAYLLETVQLTNFVFGERSNRGH